MLMKWFISSLQNNCNHMSEQDISMLTLQYCNNLINVGVLKQISEKNDLETFKVSTLTRTATNWHTNISIHESVYPQTIHRFHSKWRKFHELHTSLDMWYLTASIQTKLLLKRMKYFAKYPWDIINSIPYSSSSLVFNCQFPWIMKSTNIIQILNSFIHATKRDWNER